MSNTNTRSFHFTLGPVQAFVAQARRTRDFWAGSFLLSYLTAHAMKATQAQYGKIVMPDISKDKLIERINEVAGDGPNIASLPNVFEATVSDEFGGAIIAKAVQAEWTRIADEVWKHDGLAALKVDKKLWDDQIRSFWEIVWLIADADAPSPLAMRKNWRNHYPPEQLGDKCTMMGEWQELSGVDRPGGEIQSVFWDSVRKIAPDIRQGERLCAISYVKRRFVHAWKKLHLGWKLPTGVPSTSYLAAVHWIKQVLKHGDSDAIKTFQAAAKDISEYGEWSTSIHCIEAQTGDWGTGNKFASLDGPVFFRSALENQREYDQEKAKIVLAALQPLTQITLESGRKIGDPSPFFAILLMDGDRLGETKKALGGNATSLSKALGEFTRAVPKIVRHNNGFLVYAGGDDVLALLPLEDALNCALALRTAYMAVFAKQEIARDKYSISAAINFAHMKLPLTLVLKDVHRLLDEIAKEATGRDAIAVRVWKPGGAQLTWSMKWQSDGCNNVDALNSLVTEFQSAEADEVGHASKPLFRICERLEMLHGGDFKDEDIKKLLIAEYITSGVLSKQERKDDIAKERVEQLLPLCKQPNKPSGGDGGYGTDAALLLRFLAQKGVES